MSVGARQRARIVGLFVIWLLVPGLPAPTRAAPGQLDPTFGPGGTITTNVGLTGSAYATAVQPDGRSSSRASRETSSRPRDASP
jgi:hypothetical protein